MKRDPDASLQPHHRTLEPGASCFEIFFAAAQGTQQFLALIASPPRALPEKVALLRLALTFRGLKIALG